MVQIGEEVVGVFDADGQSQEIGWAGRARSLDARAMLDETLHAAQRRRTLPQGDPCRRCNRRTLATFHPDRQHAAEAAAHLTLRNAMTDEGSNARVEDLIHHWMRRETLGERLG